MNRLEWTFLAAKLKAVVAYRCPNCLLRINKDVHLFNEGGICTIITGLAYSEENKNDEY